MNFEYSDKVKSLQKRLTAFMDDYVYPAEAVFEAQMDAAAAARSATTSASRAYASSRTLRFADGPDEVHRNAIASMELGRYLQR
jgi:hypothetical protein